MSIENISSFWPDWELQGLIGKGGYGKVYKAVKTDHNLITEAAIKIISVPQNESELEALHYEGLDDKASKTYFSEIVDDFINEIKLMESMKGISNIVSVEDFKVVDRKDRIGWDIYIRMELLTPFSKYIEKHTLSEEEILKLGIDICTALEICSKQNIIHRDIKPENIFISRFGDFKVGDFGIAKKLEKANSTMSSKGTQSYMAPEVLRHQNYDATVDIYSLGIVLYRLLHNNRLPFMDPRSPQISYKDKQDAVDKRTAGAILPPPCNASPELASIILCACNHDPAKRFKTATAFKKALSAYQAKLADGSATVTTKAPMPTRPPIQPQGVPRPVTSPPMPPQPQAPYRQPYIPPQYTQPRPEYKQKKKKTGVIVAIILAVLLVGGVIAGLYFFGAFDSKEGGRKATDTGNVTITTDEAFHASSYSGEIFYKADGITAEVTSITFDSTYNEFYVNLSVFNNTSNTICFESNYLDVNGIILRVYAYESIDAYSTVDFELAVFNTYTNVMNISSLDDISDFLIYYEIYYDESYEIIADELAWFLTDNYSDNRVAPYISGNDLVSEDSFTAKLADVTFTDYVDILIYMDNRRSVYYYMEITELYINGELIPIPYSNDGAYYIDAPNELTVMDDFFFDDEYLEQYGLSISDISDIRICGNIRELDSEELLCSFDSGRIYRQ